MAAGKALALSIIMLLSIMGTTLQPVSCATDRTLEDKAVGVDVVEVVINMLHSSFIFKEDYDFLRRVALVESNFGLDPKTFEGNYKGGIWQLNERRFDITKNVTDYPNLVQYHKDILSSFKIDWTNSTWSNLLKPLYSVLATRLYLTTVEPIPQTLKQQAQFWIDHLSDDDKENITTFIDLVTEYENSTKCTGKMDLFVVLDESGSIGQNNFDKALDFVADLFASYSLENVRQGLMTFSSDFNTINYGKDPYRIIFPLENNLTATEIQDKVSKVRYRGGGTWTNHAITRAIDHYKETPERPGVPKIMTLFTDGQSYVGQGDPDVSNSTYAYEEGIQSFAIGIGNYEEDELNLIAYNDTTHVFGLNDFDALTEFFYRLNSETCQIPQSPNFDDITEDSLSQDAKRFYKFTISTDGMTVFLDTTVGQVSGYYSYDYKTPSSAFNYGVIDGSNGTFIASQKKGGRFSLKAGEEDDSLVYITVQGQQAKNDYKIQTEKGVFVRDSAGLSRPASVLILLMAVVSFFVYY